MIIHHQQHPGGSAEFAKNLAQGFAPFAGGDTGFCTGDGRLHDVAARGCCIAEGGKRGGHGRFIARGAPGFQFFDLREFDILGNGENFFAITR